MVDYYNEQQRIPRRRSATPDELAARTTQTGSAPAATRTRRNADDDEAYSSYPMRPMVRNLARAPLTSPKREYVIPFTDGSEMRHTERELSDMPKEYRQAAVLVTPPPAKRQALPAPQEPHTDDLPRQRRRFHWLVWVGVAMIIMLIGWVALSYVTTLWSNFTNQLTYGYPRTYQTNYNVGHGTASNPTSHFIAENLNKRIIVIEIPGDDPSKSEIYIGPTLLGDGQDLTPVTLSFEGGTPGHPNLVIHVAESKFIFLNQQVKGVWKFVAEPNQ